MFWSKPIAILPTQNPRLINPLFNDPNMGRPKRNIFAAAEETSTPPPSLTPTQAIARVMKAEGNCLYSCSLPDQKLVLVELLSRFRNTIWIKRGGYVLIDTKETDVRQNKIDGEIINVVRDEHIWRKEPYW
jgi:probable RNA-binding protein EIF1AD